MRRNTVRIGLALAAIDLLLALFAISYRQPPKPLAAIKTFGTYAVVLTWPSKCDADIDLYLREPGGIVVYYNYANGSIAHLEHDDIPATVGSAYRGQENFERIVLRGVRVGEYVVNAHVYNDYGCRPIPVAVSLWRLSGQDEKITGQRLLVRESGDEQTAFRFSLRANGDTFGINHLQRDLVG